MKQFISEPVFSVTRWLILQWFDLLKVISTRDTVCMTALWFILHIGIAAISIFRTFESQRSDSAPTQARKSNCL